MLPLWSELVSPAALTADHALGVVSFGVPVSGDAAIIPIRQLGAAPLVEVWRSSLPITRSRRGEVSFSSNGEALFGTIAGQGADTAELTSRLYEQIVQTARSAGYPHLLRVWNHVGAINECEGDLERYRRFTIGRHDALTRLGFTPEQFPAASAVGMSAAGVAVCFVASRVRGMQVENPRQVAAYAYPAVYGPRSPSFSRATVAQWDGETMIFISGTSSVVGHETRHAGDVEGQLEETLRNLEKIVAETAARVDRHATLDDLRVVKTYLRRGSDYQRVSPSLLATLPRAQHLFLESDICRRDLLIEIEGIARI